MQRNITYAKVIINTFPLDLFYLTYLNNKIGNYELDYLSLICRQNREGQNPLGLSRDLTFFDIFLTLYKIFIH